MRTKFEEESTTTDAFLKSIEINQFKLHKPENDPPDVIAEFKGKLIGIEVTDLHTDQLQTKLEKQFEKIFIGVKENLRKAGVGRLVIRIEPAKGTRIQIEQCIKSITEICLGKLVEVSEHRTELAINPNPWIKKITAYRFREDRIIITFDSRGRTFGPLRIEKVKPVIENKIIKYRNSIRAYPDKHLQFQENWLLITLKGTFYSNCSTVEDDGSLSFSDKCFDRIFIFHERDSWFHEISKSEIARI